MNSLPTAFDGFQALFRKALQSWRRTNSKPLRYSALASSLWAVEGAIESIEHGQKLLDQHFDAAMAILMPLFFDALAIIFEIRLAPQERVRQFLLLGEQFLDLLRETSHPPGRQVRAAARFVPGSSAAADAGTGDRPRSARFIRDLVFLC